MVKDYARKRNHYDLAHQQVLLIQEGGLNNNSSFKSNFKSDNNLKANIKNNNVNIKWLWAICVAMLVLFFLLIVSMKMMSNVEKTHQSVKSIPKKVSQPDFEFYDLLSDKKEKRLALDDSRSNSILTSINNNMFSVDEANNKIKKRENNISSNIINKVSSASGSDSGSEELENKAYIKDNKNKRVRKIDFSVLGEGPYHVVASGFKSYSSANKVRAELILNNIIGVVKRIDSKGEYRVFLPPANDKTVLTNQFLTLSNIGVNNYKVV